MSDKGNKQWNPIEILRRLVPPESRDDCKNFTDAIRVIKSDHYKAVDLEVTNTGTSIKLGFGKHSILRPGERSVEFEYPFARIEELFYEYKLKTLTPRDV